MRRIVPIVIFVVGLIIAMLGFTRIVPGITGGGGAMAFAGAVLFGLNFIPYPQPAPEAEAPLSPATRLGGIFYEPARIFKNLRSYPLWVAAFVAMAFFGVIYTVAFTQRIKPETIAAATMDKTIEGGFIPADQAAAIKAQQIEQSKLPGARIGGVLAQVSFVFVFMAAVAGLYLLGVLIFGGRLNFWQAMAVACYAAFPVVIIQSVLSLIILFIRSPDDLDPIKGQRTLVHADLGVLFTPSEHPYLYTIAGFFGIITFYGLWLAATGLRHTGEKVSTSAAWSVAIILWAIGLALSLGLAFVFPSFVS